VEYFSRGVPLDGTKVSNAKYAPRWARFTLKGELDLSKALGILVDSYGRIKEAIKMGEPTGYYSGGQGFSSAPAEDSDDEDT
jgi:hypothetical protein